MTHPAPSTPQAVASTPPGEVARHSAAQIDESCRISVLILLAAAGFWLGIGALFGVISAIKMHAPGFLAGVAELTFGRVRPVSLNALVYGCAMQGGLGVGLWMFCRLGRNLLQGDWIIAAGTVLWNLGLTIGLVWILAGGSTSYEWLEMPRGAALILFGAYLLIALWALITLHARQERRLYVSQWFLLTALLWFPWVDSTAQLLLFFFPARGVLQSVVAGWFGHNLFELCLGSIGLAIIFYFLPKLEKRPLHSEYLALFGFWLLVLFGGWGGLHIGEPVPNWISGLSAVSRLLLLVPILAFALNWRWTRTVPVGSSHSDPVLRFVLMAAASYLLTAALETASALPQINRITVFTLFPQGVMQLRIHGFLLAALTGAIYFIAPRLAGSIWPAPNLIRFHFWCLVFGVAFTVVPLLLGGIIQGLGIDDPENDFATVVRHTVPFLGMSTLGSTILFAGYGGFLLHLGRLLSVRCPCAATLVWGRGLLAPTPTGKAQP